MGYIIGIIIFCLLGFWIMSNALKHYGLKRVSDKVTKTTQKLKKLIENKPEFADGETYLNWLKYNPEELWARIMTHATGNKKLLGELGGKIFMACESIEKVIELDRMVSTLINAGHVKFKDIFTDEEHDGIDIEEAKNGRGKLIAIIEQSFSGIKKQLSIN